MTRPYSDLICRLDLLHAGTVAVVGPSGGGKSTLAAEVADHLGAALLSTDEFLIPEVERTAPGLLAKYDLAALSSAVARLQAGATAEYAPFDQQTRQRAGRKVVLPSLTGKLVVEGIVALYAERVLETCSLALYVDAPAEVREARQLARLEREGWYRDQPRATVEARIRAKRATEDAIVQQQIVYCQYEIDTSGPVPSMHPVLTLVAA